MSRVERKFTCPECGVDCQAPDFHPPASAKLICRPCFGKWIESFEDGETIPLPPLLLLMDPKELVA